MTVKELIKLLQTFPTESEAKIRFMCYSDDYENYYDKSKEEDVSKVSYDGEVVYIS